MQREVQGTLSDLLRLEERDDAPPAQELGQDALKLVLERAAYDMQMHTVRKDIPQPRERWTILSGVLRVGRRRNARRGHGYSVVRHTWLNESI